LTFVAGIKFQLHSFTQISANEERKLVRTPSINDHWAPEIAILGWSADEQFTPEHQVERYFV